MHRFLLSLTAIEDDGKRKSLYSLAVPRKIRERFIQCFYSVEYTLLQGWLAVLAGLDACQTAEIELKCHAANLRAVLVDAARDRGAQWPAASFIGQAGVAGLVLFVL